MWCRPQTISLMTVFRPGHRPPHVTIQACTSSDSKYTWEHNSMCDLNFQDGQKRGQQIETIHRPNKNKNRNSPTPSAEVQLVENGSLLGCFYEQQSIKQRAECLSSKQHYHSIKHHAHTETNGNWKWQKRENFSKGVIYLLGHRIVHINKILPVSLINEYFKFLCSKFIRK